MRPTNKDSLLNESQNSFKCLIELLSTIPEDEKLTPGVSGAWSVKDILSHLNAWHGLMENWYIEGMAGEKPAIPAPGYTWKTTPQLNEKIFQSHKNESLDLVSANLRVSHANMQRLIEKHSNDELFTKRQYNWTGSTSLGAYFVSATSSHYQWAIKLIKKWLKQKHII